MKLFKKIISPNGRTRIYFLNHKIFSYRSESKYYFRLLLSSYENLLSSHNNLLKYKKFVTEFIKNKYFYEHFDKPALLKDLDTESLKIITSVLSKYEYLANGGTHEEFLYDAEMISHQNTVVADFYRGMQIKQQANSGIYICNNMKLPINHFETSVFVDEHGLKKVNTSFIDKGDTIIDVGCFIADSVLIFRKYFPHNPIISFEASNENYQLAQKTAQLNDLQNVTLEKLALGDKEGEIYINTFLGAATKTSEQKDSGQVEVCSLTTLDNYVKKHNIKKVGLIKVDIEGAEQAFLHGALETIKRDRPVMLLSIYHNYSDLMHIKPYIESLNLNYKLSIHKPLDILFTEILLICEPNQ